MVSVELIAQRNHLERDMYIYTKVDNRVELDGVHFS